MEKYQTIGHRFVALIIDALVMIPLGIAASLFTTFAPNSKFDFLSSNLVSLAIVFYYILMHARYGQTLGKMAMKVKVLDISEQPITFTQSVIRSLPQMFPVFITASIASSDLISPSGNNTTGNFLSVATTVFYVSYFVWEIGDIISALISEKKRALHDFIAGTVVIKTNAEIIDN